MEVGAGKVCCWSSRKEGMRMVMDADDERRRRRSVFSQFYLAIVSPASSEAALI